MSCLNLSTEKTLEKWSDFRKYLGKEAILTFKNYLKIVTGNLDDGEVTFEEDISFIQKSGKIEKAFINFVPGSYSRGLKYILLGQDGMSYLTPTGYSIMEDFMTSWKSVERKIILDKINFPDLNKELSDLDLDMTFDGFKCYDNNENKKYQYPLLEKKFCFYNPFSLSISGNLENLLASTVEI
ncbi:MAG: hypothetical protein WC867_03565 [Candidatus Pacearchaeota archaeon]|jgi:hypothetical protein